MIHFLMRKRPSLNHGANYPIQSDSKVESVFNNHSRRDSSSCNRSTAYRYDKSNGHFTPGSIIGCKSSQPKESLSSSLTENIIHPDNQSILKYVYIFGLLSGYCQTHFLTITRSPLTPIYSEWRSIDRHLYCDRPGT